MVTTTPATEDAWLPLWPGAPCSEGFSTRTYQYTAAPLCMLLLPVGNGVFHWTADLRPSARLVRVGRGRHYGLIGFHRQQPRPIESRKPPHPRAITSPAARCIAVVRSEAHTSELQSLRHLVC